MPPWLGPRRIAVLVLLAVAGFGGAAMWDRHVRHAVLDELAKASLASTGVRAVLVRSWADAHLREARLLATVLASRPAALRGSVEADSALLAAVVSAGQFESGWILDRSGSIVAAAVGQDPQAAVRGADGRVPPSPIASDTATARAVILGDGHPVVEFTAPVSSARGPLGRVVLRAPTGLTEFHFLRVLQMSMQSERAALLVPHGDRATILTLGVHPSRDTAAPPLSVDRLPAWARVALTNGQSSGVDVGLTGERATYGATVVPGLGWLVVRQTDVSDIMGQLSEPIWINNAIFTLLIALVLIAIAALSRTRYSWRVSESARLRSEFVSSVSHELRTPLTQIRMYSEMLSGGLLTEPAETERALRVIEKESTRLAVLVDRTLSFARPAPAPVLAAHTDVAAGVRDAVTAFAPLAAERGVSVLVDVASGVQARIDRDALQQILLNLLENAVKYGPRGQTIRVGARVSSNVICIWVEDQGPGVPATERETIWRAFQRGRAAERSNTVGSGMGLAVVRDLATQFGGTASVQSVINGSASRDACAGARFVIELPAEGGVWS
jgi:signal transduction histidine kinase